MARPLLLLRPQPGNDDSAARARALGLDVLQLPLFETVAARSEAFLEDSFDAVLLTSANGARFGADVLRDYPALPVYAVGGATAQAARAAGHERVTVGAGTAAATATLMAAAGHTSVLHLCGADIRPFDPRGIAFVRQIVYRAAERADDEVRPVLDTLGEAVAAVHSPRAGHRLAELLAPSVRARIAIAAISAAAAQACGSGWGGMAVADRPDDTALLAVAESLCSSAE